MYEVYLDNVFFYGVTAFNFPHDRKIVVYNGIGTGYFPKADDPNLEKWSWECQLQEYPEHYHDNNFKPAKEIKAELNRMLASKDPVRLVMKSEYSSLSEQVLLESCQFKEVYTGVYNVSVNVTKYKEAAVRNTEIPEIPRPGKIPEAPPHPVPKDETSYDQTNEPENSWNPGHGTIHDPINNTIVDTATGEETILPVDPPPDKKFEFGGKHPWKESNKEAWDKLKNWVSNIKYKTPTYDADKSLNVFSGITNAYQNYRENIGKENEKLIEQMKNGNQWEGM